MSANRLVLRKNRKFMTDNEKHYIGPILKILAVRNVSQLMRVSAQYLEFPELNGSRGIQ